MHEEPSLLNPDGGRPCADLECLEVVLRHRHQRAGALEDEVVDVGLDIFHRDVGDPDPEPFISDAGREVHSFAVADPTEVPHRAVQHGERRNAVGP